MTLRHLPRTTDQQRALVMSLTLEKGQVLALLGENG